MDAAGNRSPTLEQPSTAKTSSAIGSTGTLAGAVFDTAGAPLANANVKVTLTVGHGQDREDERERHVEADERGAGLVLPSPSA